MSPVGGPQKFVRFHGLLGKLLIPLLDRSQQRVEVHSHLPSGRQQRIDIEYRQEVTTNHKQYLICYLVAYDEYGNRHTVKNHTWGCHDDESRDIYTFLRWFTKNLAFARQLDRERELRLQDSIQDFFDL